MSQHFTVGRLLSLPRPEYLERGMRRAEVLLEYPDFRRLKQLAKDLSLVQLLAIQPKFIYKHLSPYSALSFSRRTRLSAILTHYQFLLKKVGPAFFTTVVSQPVLWQQQCGHELLTISLSYPQQSGFEGELSLNFCLNSTIIQVISFVFVPGRIVGCVSEVALFICQVQGTRHAAQLRHVTKTLHDITPAMLLINAVYGLASALGITQAAGISTAEQLCHDKITFDYASFWQQFGGQETADNLFLLPIPAAEKPIQQIKSNHRARTLRKRQYKQQLRAAIAAHFQQVFLPQKPA